MYKRFLKTRAKMAKAARTLKWNFKFKALTVACMMLTLANKVLAGNTGVTAMNTAAQNIKNYTDSVQKVVYAIAIIIGLIGAGRIYFKYQAGDQDLMKSMIQWGASFIFLLAAASVIPNMFA